MAASKFKDLPDISTIQPERLIKYRVSEDRFSAEVLIPGLSYTDFDQKIGGKMNLWSMAKLFECIRYAALNKGFGYFDKLKDSSHSVFMVGTNYHVTNLGNKLNSYRHWGMNFPIYATLKMTNVGNASLFFVVECFEKQSMKMLFSAALTFAYVNLKTRKSAEFPPWFMEAKKNKTFGQPMPRLDTPKIPESAFQYEVKSTYSDLDFNGHVNQSICVKWCTDTGTEAALKGHYCGGFNGNIGKYPLKSLDLKYISEGMVDQSFVIYTWQDRSNPLVLHFVVTRNGRITIVAKFVYYRSDVDSRL